MNLTQAVLLKNIAHIFNSVFTVVLPCDSFGTKSSVV